MCERCVEAGRFGSDAARHLVIRAIYHRPVGALTRKFIWERDGGNCRYCGCALLFKETSIDHVVPVVLGGTDDLDNLALSCRSCNQSKGSRLVPDPLRLAKRHAIEQDRRTYDRRDLFWEESIVQVKPFRDLPYVREQFIQRYNRARAIPKDRLTNVFAYSMLKAHCPPHEGEHEYYRRVWLLDSAEYDFQRHVYKHDSLPDSAVDPRSIRLGTPSVFLCKP